MLPVVHYLPGPHNSARKAALAQPVDGLEVRLAGVSPRHRPVEILRELPSQREPSFPFGRFCPIFGTPVEGQTHAFLFLKNRRALLFIFPRRSPNTVRRKQNGGGCAQSLPTARPSHRLRSNAVMPTTTAQIHGQQQTAAPAAAGATASGEEQQGTARHGQPQRRHGTAQQGTAGDATASGGGGSRERRQGSRAGARHSSHSSGTAAARRRRTGVRGRKTKGSHSRWRPPSPL